MGFNDQLLASCSGLSSGYKPLLRYILQRPHNLELTIKTVKSTLCQFVNLPSKNVSQSSVPEIGVTKPRYPDQISPGADVSSREVPVFH